MTERAFSGIQPTGGVHLGNYVGALRQWVNDQHDYDSIYCIVDLHAITLPIDPSNLREQTLEMAQTLLAIGLDGDASTLIIQSHLSDLHNRLTSLLENLTGMGDLRRMTQFKDKSDGKDESSVGLFTYPVLMAADILLYDTTRVPVGEDQRQHVELARDIARRLNKTYGKVVTVPRAVTPVQGARIRNLQNPAKKMSKSDPTGEGVIFLFEDFGSIEKKILASADDSQTRTGDDDVSPGTANLLALLGAATDAAATDVADLAGQYSNFDLLKRATAAAVIEMLRPIQERKRELEKDPAEVLRIFRAGEMKARTLGEATDARVSAAMGLLARAAR